MKNIVLLCSHYLALSLCAYLGIYGALLVELAAGEMDRERHDLINISFVNA
jgi:hypothetical protein